jgi:hypothetical protein
MSFNTVQEVTAWKDFVLDEQTYDLSHLKAHWAEYLDRRNAEKPITYRFIVTYGLHCFTKGSEALSPEDSRKLMYKAPRESREFNFERYELSKLLPSIVQSLGDKETFVAHAGHGQYATVKIVNAEGCEVDYFVPFSVFRETKKLRLHVRSAYTRPEGIGKVRKVGFFVIANNRRLNKPLPKP